MPSSDAARKARRAAVVRGLVWFHRWAGLLLCLLFAMWFASGAVLTFVPFPSLSESDRLARSEPIDWGKLQVEPADLANRGSEMGDVSLVSVAGRPVYLAMTAGKLVATYGDDGTEADLIGPEIARHIAETFAGTAVAAVEPARAYDQWTVHQHFDPYRPFYRISVADEAETQLYVSARSGEVLQRTTRSQRLWNLGGAVMHWIYFTPIRSDWPLWNQLVWWLSLAAVFVAVAGFWLGILRYLYLRRAGRPGMTPYKRWMAWHHVSGLLFGTALLGWMVSGWLSMDHGRLFSRGQASALEASAVRGMTVQQILRSESLTRIQHLGAAAQVDFGAVAGHPLVVLRGAGAPRLFLEATDPVSPLSRLPDTVLAAAVLGAWPGTGASSVNIVAPDDLYFLAEGMPEGTRSVESGSTTIYLDPLLGRVVTVMDPSRRAYAWVYYAVHTLNFPGLAARPLLRVSLVLILLSGGFVLSLTGVVIAAKRLRRSLS